MSDFRKRLSAIDPERLFGAATDTELLVDIGYNHLKGDDRRSCAGAIRRERLPLAKAAALEGIRDVQHYRKLWKDQCVKVEAAEARAREHLPALRRERALLDRACEMRDEAVLRAMMLHCAEIDSDVSARQIGTAKAMVGGQDDDDLEARLRYALAVGGAVPGETLIDAGARASAERDDLRAQLGEARLESLQARAELTLARRPWWRRLAGWWGGLP